MKKILAIMLAVFMLVSVFSVNVFAVDETEEDTADVQGTTSTSFLGACENDYPWSRVVNPDVGWEPPSEGWLDTSVIKFQNWHFNITDLVLKAAGVKDIANIVSVKATVELVGKDSIGAYRTEGNPAVQLEYGKVYNPNGTAFGADAAYMEDDIIDIAVCNNFEGSKATVSGKIPAGAKVITLDLGGFGKITKEDNQKFVITVEVEYTNVVTVNDVAFDGTLQEAVTAAEDGATIKVGKNLTGAGVVVPEGKSITIDFGGNTYTVDATAGSTGTETNGFQLLKGANVTLKNGTLTGETARILIQNYADLTLDNMNVVSANADYVVSNNNGKLNVIGNTSIKAADGKTAFDMYYWPKNGYDTINVTVNTTGTITGNIEISADGSADFDTVVSKLTLDLQAGTFKGNFVVDAEGLNFEMPAGPRQTNLYVHNGFDAENGTELFNPFDGAPEERRNNNHFIGGAWTGKSYPADFLTAIANENALIEVIASEATSNFFSNGHGYCGDHSVATERTEADGKVIEVCKAADVLASVFAKTNDLDNISDLEQFAINVRNSMVDDVCDPVKLYSFRIYTVEEPSEPTEEDIKAALYKALADKDVVKLADGTKFTDPAVKHFGFDTITGSDGSFVIGEEIIKATADRRQSGVIYIDEEYHGMLINGHLLTYPHEADNALGYCPVCNAIIEANEEVEVEVVDPTEPGDVETETDEPTIEVTEPEQPTEEEKNPPMGIAFAVLPMAVAAAALVSSKRR